MRAGIGDSGLGIAEGRQLTVHALDGPLPTVAGKPTQGFGARSMKENTPRAGSREPLARHTEVRVVLRWSGAHPMTAQGTLDANRDLANPESRIPNPFAPRTRRNTRTP